MTQTNSPSDSPLAAVPALHVLKTYATAPGVPICLHENKFFRMMFNGHFHYLDMVRHARGAIAVPVFENGDVLLVRILRVPAVGLSWEFPRGGVDPRESDKAGVLRELSEETGYAVPESAATYVGQFSPDTATLNQVSPVFLVRIPAEAEAGVFDAEEISSVKRVSRDEFEAMIARGGVEDGQTLAAWCLAKGHLA